MHTPKIPKQMPRWIKLFLDGGPYHIETSPLICRGNLVLLLVLSRMKMKMLNEKVMKMITS